MNFCPNCGMKNENNENFCADCGRELTETIEVNSVEKEPVKSVSSKKTSSFSLLNRNIIANILLTIVIIYFYKELLYYMDYFDNRAGSIFRLLLMIGAFSYVLLLHYKKTSLTIWIPGLISLLFAILCFVQYELFKEYVAWTETQGYNTQMSVDPSAAGALTAYGLVYSLFFVSILIIYFIKYGKSIAADKVANN